MDMFANDGPASTLKTIAWSALNRLSDWRKVKRFTLWAALRCFVLLLGFPHTCLAIYGAPYRFDYAYGPNPRFPTVSEAIDYFWADYQQDWWWAFPGCGYTLTGYPNGRDTGRFAFLLLQGTCGGGGTVRGTPYPYDPGKNDGLPQICVGNPVNPATGNKYQAEMDYAAANGVNVLKLQRHYNSSQSAPGSEFGPNWRHHYSRSVFFDGSANATAAAVYRPDGKVFNFVSVNGAWAADADISDTLERLYDISGNPAGWEYHAAADDRMERYNLTGKLLSLTSRDGSMQSLVYSDAATPVDIAPKPGLPITVIDSNGARLRFTYNAQSNIATMTDPAGGVFRYDYDANGNLATVIYPDGAVRTYHYNESAHTGGVDLAHALTGITDENGVRFSTYRYDARGRAIASEHAGGADKVDLSYSNAGPTTVTDALGTARTYSFQTILGVVRNSGLTQSCPACGSDTASTTYDANGNIASRTDFNGNLTTYTYDLARNLEISRTEAVGTAEQRIVSTEWHPIWRVVQRIAAPHRLITLVWGDMAEQCGAIGVLCGKIVQATSDADGSQGFEATPVGPPRTWTYTYNDRGRILSTDGPRDDVDDVTTYAYYANDEPEVNNRLRLKTVTNALGHVVTYHAYDAHGHPIRITDPDGIETILRYDARSRLLESVRASESTYYDYDPAGNLIRQTNADGSWLDYHYDSAHRLIAISDSWGNRIDYTLDGQGHRIEEKGSDPDGALVRFRQQHYDHLGRLFERIGAQGQTDRYQYDSNGNLITLTDAESQTTQYRYDALDRLVENSDPQGGLTSYLYDGSDRLSRVVDPNHNATNYLYGNFGALAEQQSPDSGLTQFDGDAAGNRIARTDAQGQTTAYRYDALNRLSRVEYDNNAVDYRYDHAVNGLGQIDRIIETSGELRWAYNGRGRVHSKTQIVNLPAGGSQTLSAGYRYDAQGRPGATIYPSGLVVSYAYELDRLVEVRVDGQVLLWNFAYQPFGEVAAWTRANGTTHLRDYDADGRLEALTLGWDSRQLEYDLRGDLVRIQDATNDWTFDYDPLSRLTAARDAIHSLDWVYDANGNRVEQHANGLATFSPVQPDSNRLHAVGTRTYHYDANGNVLDDGRHRYAYDGQNRLVSVDATAGRYRYNALGRRIAKTVPDRQPDWLTFDLNRDGVFDKHDLRDFRHSLKKRAKSDKGKSKLATIDPQLADCDRNGNLDKNDLTCLQAELAGSDTVAGETRLFMYDESGHLLGEYTDRGAPIQETVWLGDIPVAVVRNGRRYAVHVDHLNTPRLITDPNGREVWRWDDGLPFGENAPDEDPDGDGIKFVYNLRFPGQYFDAESGLHYNYFRYYDPNSGRYITSDPIGLHGGLNTYAYVDFNPLTFIDPEGAEKRTYGQRIIDVPEGRPLIEGQEPLARGPVVDGLIGLATLVAPELAGSRLCPSTVSAVTKRAAPAKRASNQTVLGSYPEYVKLSDKLGARRFEIPTDVWNRMSQAERWTANQKFLDRMISKGDEVILSNPASSAQRGTSFFREIEYLKSQRYRVSDDGLGKLPGS